MKGAGQHLIENDADGVTGQVQIENDLAGQRFVPGEQGFDEARAAAGQVAM